MADMFNPKEIHYRFYAGDGNETNSTAKENEDTNHVLTVDIAGSGGGLVG